MSNYTVSGEILNNQITFPISYNKENEEFKMPIRFSIQGAYEFDLNPYDQGFLPRYTTLYTFTNISKSSYSTDVYLSQEFQL